MQHWTVMVKNMRGRLPFVAALWTAIAVAMLSAMVPSGLPSTRTAGSAFDPATSLVVLKARSPVQAMATRASEPDEPVPPSPVMWWLPIALLAVAFRFALRSVGPIRSGPGVRRSCPSERPRARAPPIRRSIIA